MREWDVTTLRMMLMGGTLSADLAFFFRVGDPMGPEAFEENQRQAERKWAMLATLAKTVHLVVNGSAIALDAVLSTKPEGVAIQTFYCEGEGEFLGYVSEKGCSRALFREGHQVGKAFLSGGAYL